MDSWSSYFSSVAHAAQKTVQSATERVKQKAKEHHEKFLAEREAHVRSEEEAIPVLSRLPWEGLGASDRAREAAGEVKAAVLAFSDDRATYTTSPPPSAGWAFDLRARVEAVERLLKAVPAVDKHRFKLVPRVVSEEAFFSNFFYKAELVRDSARVRLEAEEGEAVSVAAAAAAASVPEGDAYDHSGRAPAAAASSQGIELEGHAQTSPTRRDEALAVSDSPAAASSAASRDDGGDHDTHAAARPLLGRSPRSGSNAGLGGQSLARAAAGSARKESVLDALEDHQDDGALGGGGLDGELDDALERATRMERPASPEPAGAEASPDGLDARAGHEEFDAVPEPEPSGPDDGDDDLFDLDHLSDTGDGQDSAAQGDEAVDDDELEAAIAAELAQSDDV